MLSTIEAIALSALFVSIIGTVVSIWISLRRAGHADDVKLGQMTEKLNTINKGQDEIKITLTVIGEKISDIASRVAKLETKVEMLERDMEVR